MKDLKRILYLLVPALFALALLRYPPDGPDRSSDRELANNFERVFKR
ncbi:MAG: hypothetical protein ACOYT8_04595 [Candidatus Dependentiae bacterium]